MKCYLCGSEKSHKREGKVRDNPSINILECDECGLVFLDTQNTGDEFYEQNNMLNVDYFKYTKRDKDTLSNQIIAIQKEWELRAKSRAEFLEDALIGKEILDFGSGQAQFLRFAKDLAKSVVGVELEEQVKPIYEKYNIPLARSLEEAKNLIINGGGRL